MVHPLQWSVLAAISIGLAATTGYCQDEGPGSAGYMHPADHSYTEGELRPQLVYVPGESGENRWKLIFAPYLWAAGLKGSVTSNGSSTKIDQSFTDILPTLKFGATGHLELWRDRFFLMSDTNFVWTEADGEADKKISGPLGGTISGKIDAVVDSKTLIQELMAGYRFYERNLDAAQERKMGMDLYGGMRYYNLDTTVDVDASVKVIPPIGPPFKRKLDVEVNSSDQWIDPVIGSRIVYDLHRDLSLSLWGDVGGFGVGSKFSYSATALAEWRFHDNMSLVGGYKILGFDYDKGGNAYDLRMQGPISTVALRFEF